MRNQVFVPDGFWEASKEMFLDDSRTVQELLDKNQIIFALAPHRIGKSESFRPLLKEHFEVKGYRVHTQAGPHFIKGKVQRCLQYDFLSEDETPDVFMGIPKLFILDEAIGIIDTYREMSKRKEILAEIFVALREENIRAVFILAGRTAQGREMIAYEWSNYVAESDLAVATHVIKAMYVPAELVKQLLRCWNATEELVNFFLAEENRALRTCGALAGFIHALEFGYPPIQPFRTLHDLRAYLAHDNNWEKRLAMRIGGSTNDWLTVVKNLGIDLNEDKIFSLGLYPEYD